jgi:hypothetical protein
LPYQEIDHDIERRRARQHTSGRHRAAAASHQTRQCCATQAPCRARQVKVGKESQLGRTAPKSQKPAKQAKPAAVAREGSKAAKVLGLLRRPAGASLKELMKTTGWLAHSVRGFLSGTVAKRMGFKLVSAKGQKGQDGERRYFVER